MHLRCVSQHRERVANKDHLPYIVLHVFPFFLLTAYETQFLDPKRLLPSILALANRIARTAQNTMVSRAVPHKSLA